MGERVCTKCNELKPLSEYGKCSNCFLGVKPSCRQCRYIEYKENIPRIKKYQEENKERISAYNKEWREANKEDFAKIKKDYNNNNREKIREYARKYSKNRRKHDPIYKLTCDIRTLILLSFNKSCLGIYSKKSSTEDILGCTVIEFIEHLQSLFTEGMTLGNHGSCEECWHIDHKIPLATAETEEEIYKLNHYTNLQPLWRNDNLSKGCKII